MYDEPYGLVEPGRRSDVRKELPVAINAVDGKSTRSTRYSDPISPGKHQIQLMFASDRLPSDKASRLVDLDIQPCVRYRVVAAYQSRTYPANWEPKVYVEPIVECEKKFGVSTRR